MKFSEKKYQSEGIPEKKLRHSEQPALLTIFPRILVFPISKFKSNLSNESNSNNTCDTKGCYVFVPIMKYFGLLLLVNNVKWYQCWLLPLTSLTTSSSLQNGKTQIGTDRPWSHWLLLRAESALVNVLPFLCKNADVATIAFIDINWRSTRILLRFPTWLCAVDYLWITLENHHPSQIHKESTCDYWLI